MARNSGAGDRSQYGLTAPFISFNGNKTVTAGAGWLIVVVHRVDGNHRTPDDDDGESRRGLHRAAWIPDYRMSNIQAAVGARK